MKNKTLIIACFIMMILSFGIIMNCIGVFLTPIRMEFGYLNSSVSLIISIISIGMVIGAQPIAILMDIKGIRITTLLCVVLTCTGIFLFSASNQLWQFYSCALIIGIGLVGNGTMPVSLLMNALYDGKNPGLALSMALMGSGVGGAIFNPLLTAIINGFGWRIGFASIIFFYITYIPILIFMVPDDKKSAAPLDNVTVEKGWAFDKAIKSKRLWLFVLVFGLANATCSIFISQLVPYLIWTGLTASLAALIMGVCSALMSAGKVLTGWNIDKIGINKSTFLGTALLVLGAILLHMARIYSFTILLFVFCFAMGIPTVTVCMPGIVDKYFGNKDFTRIFGVFNIGFGAGGAAGPLALGLITDASGGYDIVWVFVALSTLVAVSVFVLLVTRISI